MRKSVQLCHFAILIVVNVYKWPIRITINLLAVHYHGSGGRIGGQSPANHSPYPSPELQESIAERARMGMPLRVMELQDEPFFYHHLEEFIVENLMHG